jgi:hypothetical protein
LFSCNINSGSAVIINPNDTLWVINVNNNITKKTLIANNNKIEEIYYTNDKVDSFFIYDIECGEARFVNPQFDLTENHDSIFYTGCIYTEDVTKLKTIDSIYSVYLPEQRTLDSFNFTLWTPIEKEKHYYFSIYVDTLELYRSIQNSPIVKIKLPYRHDKKEIKYFLIRKINNKGKVYQTRPMPLFREIHGKIKLLSENTN